MTHSFVYLVFFTCILVYLVISFAWSTPDAFMYYILVFFMHWDRLRNLIFHLIVQFRILAFFVPFWFAFFVQSRIDALFVKIPQLGKHPLTSLAGLSRILRRCFFFLFSCEFRTKKYSFVVILSIILEKFENRYLDNSDIFFMI